MSNLVNKLIFKKYRVKKLISSTSSSLIYEGVYEKKNEPVLMKFENKTKNKYLQNEAYLLYELKGFGIPKIISYGKSGLYNILIEELLGETIYKLWKNIKKEFKLKNICMIVLEFIHSKNIIYRDIKPSNFVIGEKIQELFI